MKALQCVELAGPEKLIFGDVEDLKPNAGEVLVHVKAASVNFPDVLMIQGLYQFQPPMPFISRSRMLGNCCRNWRGCFNMQSWRSCFCYGRTGLFC